MITKDEIKEATDKFSKEFGETTALRANLAAINKMLSNRGKDQELYKIMLDIMERYREKQNGEEKDS